MHIFEKLVLIPFRKYTMCPGYVLCNNDNGHFPETPHFVDENTCTEGILNLIFCCDNAFLASKLLNFLKCNTMRKEIQLNFSFHHGDIALHSCESGFTCESRC